MQLVLKNLLKYDKKALDNHDSTKQTYVRGKHLPVMNKAISEAITHRTRFRNKYLKNKADKTKESIQNNEITVFYY